MNCEGVGMSKQEYAVKCEKVITFYIDVEADNEESAQGVAEYKHTLGETGYGSGSSFRAVSAVKVITEEELLNDPSF